MSVEGKPLLQSEISYKRDSAVFPIFAQKLIRNLLYELQILAASEMFTLALSTRHDLSSVKGLERGWIGRTERDLSTKWHQIKKKQRCS